MPTNFSVTLPSPSGPVGAPVLKQGQSPLVGILGTLSQGLQEFSEHSANRKKQKAAEAKAAQEQRQNDAVDYMFDSFLRLGMNEGEARRQDPHFQLVTGLDAQAMNAPASANEGVTGGGGETPIDTATSVIEGAINSGVVAYNRFKELDESTQTAAAEMRNIDESIAQGNMPSNAKGAAVDRVLLDMREKFSDVPFEVLLAAMKKQGIDVPAFRELENSLRDRNVAGDARAKQYSESVEMGLEVMGPAGAAMTDSQLAAIGMEQIRLKREMEAATDKLSLVKTQGEVSEAQRNREIDDAANTLRQTSWQSYIGVMSPIVEDLHKLMEMMPEAGANPALEEEFQKTIDLMKEVHSFRKQEILAQVAASNVPNALELREKLEKQMDNTFNDTILGPLENRDGRTSKVLKMMKDQMGIGLAQSFPLITAFKEMGINMQLTETLLGAMDSEDRQLFANELGRLTNVDLFSLTGRSSAQRIVGRAAMIMKGEQSLEALGMSPQDAARVFGVIDRSVKTLTPKVGSGDYENADAWVNSVGEVAIVAGQLRSGVSNKALTNAMLSISGGGHPGAKNNAVSIINNLMGGKADNVDGEYAQAVGLGLRSGVANLMTIARKKAAQEYGIYDISYDESSLKWKLTINAERKRVAQAQLTSNPAIGGGEGGFVIPQTNRTVSLKPSKEAKDLVNVLNTGQSMLVASQKWDENSPKANNRELSLWYSQGKPPKSMIEDLKKGKEDSEKERTPVEPSEIFKTLTEIQSRLNEDGFSFDIPTIVGPGGAPINEKGQVVLKNLKGRDVIIKSPNEIREGLKGKPALGYLEQGADKYGIPRDLAVVLIGGMENRELNNNAKAKTSRGHAWGIMQIHDADWDKKAQEMFGKKVRSLNPKENIEMGLWILKQNYDKYGNWTDAISAYHSGISLEEAEEKNRNDGNIRTSDYVRGIIGASRVK